MVRDQSLKLGHGDGQQSLAGAASCLIGTSPRAWSSWMCSKTRRVNLASRRRILPTFSTAWSRESTVTQVRDGIYLVNVVGRADDADRSSIDNLLNLQITKRIRAIDPPVIRCDLPLRTGTAHVLHGATVFRPSPSRPDCWATSSPRPSSMNWPPRLRPSPRHLPDGYSIAGWRCRRGKCLVSGADCMQVCR